MKEDWTAITQDDSGLLHAATVAGYARIKDKQVNKIMFDDFYQWATENGAEFIIGSKSDFRWLQRQIVNNKLNADRAAELSTLLEDHEGQGDEYMNDLLYFLDESEATN